MHAETSTPEFTAVLALGSNLGDRRSHLETALTELTRRGVQVHRCSQWHETEAVGPPQPNYLNGVATVSTALSADSLLDLCQEVERSLGRDRGGVRWGPRTIDIDILVLGDEQRSDARLTLPHPRIAERRFVLGPWRELEPDRPVPGLQATVNELWQKLIGETGP